MDSNFKETDRKAVRMVLIAAWALCALATFAGAVDNSPWYLVPGIPSLVMGGIGIARAWRNAGL